MLLPPPAPSWCAARRERSTFSFFSAACSTSPVHFEPQPATAVPCFGRALDKKRADTFDEEQNDTTSGGGGRGRESEDLPLSPLGEGIPLGSSPWTGSLAIGSGAGADGGASGNESLPLLKNSRTGGKSSFSSTSTQPLGDSTAGISSGTDGALWTRNGSAAQVGRDKNTAGGSAIAGGDGGAERTHFRREGGSEQAPLSATEKAKRAPLRFYLVREGHKFVAVGRPRTKGAWKELPEMMPAPGDGIPIVLDPSPYQVRVYVYVLCVFRVDCHTMIAHRSI